MSRPDGVWPKLVVAVTAVGCSAAPRPRPVEPTPPPPARVAAPAWGTADPYRIVAIPPDGRWALICQARADTNHDGKIAVHYEIHGEDAGDVMSAYLIDPSGHETIVDNYLDSDPTGRWLAIVEHGAPILIDTATWKRTPLTGTLPQFRITRGRADWRFSPDGRRLLFMRGGAPIVRDLASGSETAIASTAYTTNWNRDGSWVELEILDGDTNHDGFTHGPDLQPEEGTGGDDCGYKFDWGNTLQELVPDLGARTQAAVDSIDKPDDLTHYAWRVSDHKLVRAEQALDDDTIVSKRTDGTLALGKLDGPARPIPAGCAIESWFAPAQSVVLTCKLARSIFAVRYWRPGADIELYRGAIEPLLLGDNTGFFEIWAKPHATFFDATTGQVFARRTDVHRRWSDDDHLLIAPEDDDPLELYTRGERLPITFGEGSTIGPTGHYLAIGKLLLDLTTFHTRELLEDPIAIRTDGDELVDGGPISNDRYERVHRGPLRWIAPR